jgi:plastocyanin
MGPRALWNAGIAGTFALTLAACGGSSPPAAPSGNTGNTGTIAATITITSTGVSPKTVTVAPGSRVTFVNNDSRNHEMNSDPHPTHGDCPGLDQVGFLAPNQSKTSGNLNTARACGFHDHLNDSNTSLQGTIFVQ